jgi:hypothetical protein
MFFIVRSVYAYATLESYSFHISSHTQLNRIYSARCDVLIRDVNGLYWHDINIWDEASLLQQKENIHRR